MCLIASSLVFTTHPVASGTRREVAKPRAGLAFRVGLCAFAATWTYSASGWAKETPTFRRPSVAAESASPAPNSTNQDAGAQSDTPSDQPSGGVAGYLAGGMGGLGAGDVVVPGGGLTVGLLYQTQVGIGIGMGGSCAGGTAKAENDPNETRAALLCAGSALVEWVMPTAKYAPLLGLNASYAYAGYADPDETVGRFSGRGAMLSPRAGALIGRRWLVAPALSIQRLAGHEDLQTTLGYMHLAKGETERAIRLLDEPFFSAIASAVLAMNANGNLTATERAADQNTAG